MSKNTLCKIKKTRVRFFKVKKKVFKLITIVRNTNN